MVVEISNLVYYSNSNQGDDDDNDENENEKKCTTISN